MEILIHTQKLKYVGEEPFYFRYKDGRIYEIGKNDVVVLPDDHYSRFLKRKSFFIEAKEERQERTKEGKKPTKKQKNAEDTLAVDFVSLDSDVVEVSGEDLQGENPSKEHHETKSVDLLEQ